MADLSKTLAIGPLPHPAMDYAALRSEGLRLLGALGGGQWTDFNSHDPGVTILEQFCYAITDLGYRINYAIPDLLAGGEADAHASLPSAATILSCRPTTVSDLRKLAMDACGGGNAWVAVGKPVCPYFFHEQSGELHLEPDPAALEGGAVALHGLHRVWLPTGEFSDAAGREQAVARLGAARPLCEDISVEMLRSEPIWLDAAIEVDGGVTAQQILDAIVDNIEAYLAPRVGFEDLATARLRCAGHEQTLFDGPTLTRGFLCDRKLAAATRRRTVYASDLMHAITDVPAVRAIQRLTMAKSAGGKLERWALEIGEAGVPTLATGSRLLLLRDGLPLPLDADALSAALARARSHAADPVLDADARDLAVAPGRDRRLGRYHSLLNQFPLTYGVGRFGLPPSVSAARRAQAKQLRAFVLLFDQILANCFAQLAHARELFSHFEGAGEAPQTYFGQVVSDPAIDLDALRRLDPARHQAWLEAAVVDTAVDELGSLERRARFLGHLLARYAEQLDVVDVGGQDSAIERTRGDIRRKLAFLRDYPQISGGRGSGYDIARPDSVAGLAWRLRLELGVPADAEHPGFELVEHLLLRPIEEDQNQRGEEGEEAVPLLAGIDAADPYSMQLAVVFREPPAALGEAQVATYEQLVERLVAEYTPAHLGVTLHWFGDEQGGAHWSSFVVGHRAFRQALAAYRALRLQGSAAAAEDLQFTQLRLRDARDWLLEYLLIGATYPLRDIPMPSLIIVPADSDARIPLGYSQRGVSYRLCDHRSGEAIVTGSGKQQRSYEVVGTGGPVELPTPPVLEDVNYKIMAIRPKGHFGQIGERAVWLHTEVTLKEGVDASLDAHIDAPVLDKRIDNPRSTDARIVHYGDVVQVLVDLSQEGVHYELVDHAAPERILSAAVVTGTGGTIAISSQPISEDLDLRVRAQKQLDPEHAGGVIREALLDVVLPLRVRASLEPEVVVSGGEVLGFAKSTRLEVRQGQASVRYRVWARDIDDERYCYDEPPTVPVIEVGVGEGEGARTVRVRRTELKPWWQDQDRFVRIGGDAKLSDAGTTASFDLGPFEHDQAVLLQAVKTHEIGPLDQPSRGVVDSAIELRQARAILVGPNPKPGLRLRVVEGADQAARVELHGGQPGVYYALVKTGGKATVAYPAYVHQRDDADSRSNKGVGQLRIEIDLALAREPTSPSVDRGREAPLDPALDLSGVVDGTRWKLVARKAMTSLEVDLSGRANTATAPAVSLEPASVPAGSSAKLTVAASDVGMRYLLEDAAGAQLAAAVGTGEALVLDSGPLSASARLTVVAQPLADDPIIVERAVERAVEQAVEVLVTVG